MKPTYLKDHGHDVLNPALPDDNFDAAVRIAQAEYDHGKGCSGLRRPLLLGKPIQVISLNGGVPPDYQIHHGQGVTNN